MVNCTKLKVSRDFYLNTDHTPFLTFYAQSILFFYSFFLILYFFISQGDDYVLPLRLWGKPMTMSCPAVLPPPSVSCFPSGMVVKFGGIAANELKVKGR